MEKTKTFSVLRLRGRDNMQKITFYSACMVNDNLKALYQQLEDRDDFDGVDVYQIGDIINLLDGLKIEVIDAEKADW